MTNVLVLSKDRYEYLKNKHPVASFKHLIYSLDKLVVDGKVLKNRNMD